MKIPTGEHYALITVGSIFIPGDERSRTNPGHGYPDHTEETVDYEVCSGEEELKEKLRSRAWGPRGSDGRVFGIHVTEMYVIDPSIAVVRTVRP